MDVERIWRPFGWTVIAGGLLLSFFVAVLPFYETGYRMAFGLFLVGIVPYVVYGTLTPYLRGVSRGVVGGFVLLIDLVTRLPKRLDDDPLAGVSTYWLAPMAMTAVVVAMVWFMGRSPEPPEGRTGGSEGGVDSKQGTGPNDSV